MPYFRNVWYVAGWASELKSGGLLRRRLLEQAILMFRDQQGVPHALLDRCPHRFAPLSMGKWIDGVVECPYHGLRFDGGGQCVFNPQGDHIPQAAVVKHYPIVERYSALWIWMGDPGKADATLIPDFSFMDPEHWYVGTSSMLVEGNYELETDNILDLSHIEFLHPVFSTEAVRRGKVDCVGEGETIWSKRFMARDTLPEFLAHAFNIPPGELADRWLDVRWNAPACMALWAGAVVSGKPREQGTVVQQAHLFTPQDEHTTHYFYSISFPRALGSQGEQLARDNVAMLDQVFTNEDKPIIEAQARTMAGNEFWSLKPVLLRGDAAAVLARRVLAKQIAAQTREESSG
jgi:phenylpropionate dioxygenase-like ring-hydroxylating dioxygenase large terminal subunit